MVSLALDVECVGCFGCVDIFVQNGHHPGDWTPVVARVRAELSRLLAERRADRALGHDTVRHPAMVHVAHDLQTFPVNPASGDGLPPGAAAAAGIEPNRQGLAARTH